MLLTIIPMVAVFALPLYESAVSFYFLREESNLERYEALLTYLELIESSPFVGLGPEEIRTQVEEFGMKPSHNFFVEMIATFGFLCGGVFLGALGYLIGVKPAHLDLRVLGVFALGVGLFNNTLYLSLTFLPAIVSMIIFADRYWAALQPARALLPSATSAEPAAAGA